MMDLVSSVRDVQLKLALTDTDLLDLLRSGRQARTRINKAKPGTGSEVLACYSRNDGTLTVTGVFHGRFPVNFVLRPGTRTYTNFIRYLLQELESLPEDKSFEAPGADYRGIVEGLARSLQARLTAIDLETHASLDNIGDIVEVFQSDFEQANGSYNARLVPLTRIARAPSATHKRRLIRNFSREHRFRLFIDEKQPQLISGFLSLEIEEVSARAAVAVPEAADAVLTKAIREKLHLQQTGAVIEKGGAAEVTFTFDLDDPALLKRLSLYIHWGRCGGNHAEDWVDEEVGPEDLVRTGANSYKVTKELSPAKKGRFGAVLCAMENVTRERFWSSRSPEDDLKFQIAFVEEGDHAEAFARLEVIENIDIKGRLLQGLASFDAFVRSVNQLSKAPSARGLGKILFDLTKGNSALRALVSDYYQRTVLELEQAKTTRAKARYRTVLNVLKNIGIGEVVFVAPEGPHAIAGGLAQVVVGLTKSLARCGVACTVITPLYEESQGNKHTSAEKLLADGVRVVDKIVPIRRVGEIKIPFGPTCVSGTSKPVQFARTSLCRVYMAENENVRIIFLRHPTLASRLYAPGWGDDQIRRALFLSRGALEIVRDRRFNIAPHILVTNDWPTAFVPVLLRTDPAYLHDSRLQGVETVHIMHNCGQGYQGRFPVNQFGEDLFPMIGIASGHFFGLTEPEDVSLFNLTAAAALHSGKALVAVSKPYAGQLLTEKGGEGLHSLFSRGGNILFGVSNGVDLSALRTLFWKLGETARDQLGLTPLMRSRFSEKRLIKKLPDYKQATKLIVQKKHGLQENPNAVLISLVGRLAEQKGIQLLSGCPTGDNCSVLEAVLRQYPEVQFFIGGPPSEGDQSVADLQRTIRDLLPRYPGRISAVFDFIPHQQALEITQSSDIFLMPSRYEPGGITQLEALATGTLVVARNVGGIAATLANYSPERNEGNSFLFKEFSSTALKDVLLSAIETVKDPGTRSVLIARAAGAEHDWSHRVPKYLSILQYVAGVFEPRSYYAHLAPRWHLLNSLRPA